MLFQTHGLPAGGVEAVPAVTYLLPACQRLFRGLPAAEGLPLPVQIFQTNIQLRPVCPVPGKGGGGCQTFVPVVFRQNKPLFRVGVWILSENPFPFRGFPVSVRQGKAQQRKAQHTGSDTINDPPENQQRRPCQECGNPQPQEYKPVLFPQAFVSQPILSCLCFGAIRAQVPERPGGLGRQGRGRKHLFFQLGRAPLLSELPGLQDFLPGFLPGGKPGADPFQRLRPFYRPVIFLPGLRHLGGIRLRPGVPQGLGVVAQRILPGRHLALADAQLLCLLFQSFKLRKLLL